MDFRLYVGDIEGSPGLWRCHGSVDLGMTFYAALGICVRFLGAHPYECLIISVKNDRKDDVEFEELVRSTFKPYIDKKRLSTGTSVPTLGEVRGRMVLLRRFEHYGGLDIGGIDASGSLWPSNSPEEHVNHWGVKLYIQDEYRFYTIFNASDKFVKYMLPLLNNARTDSNGQALYINFASGTGVGVPLGFSPENLALETNSLLLDYIISKPKGRYGVLAMDFPPDSLVGKIISTN